MCRKYFIHQSQTNASLTKKQTQLMRLDDRGSDEIQQTYRRIKDKLLGAKKQQSKRKSDKK